MIRINYAGSSKTEEVTVPTRDLGLFLTSKLDSVCKKYDNQLNQSEALKIQSAKHHRLVFESLGIESNDDSLQLFTDIFTTGEPPTRLLFTSASAQHPSFKPDARVMSLRKEAFQSQYDDDYVSTFDRLICAYYNSSFTRRTDNSATSLGAPPSKGPASGAVIRDIGDMDCAQLRLGTRYFYWSQNLRSLCTLYFIDFKKLKGMAAESRLMRSESRRCEGCLFLVADVGVAESFVLSKPLVFLCK